MVSMQLAFKFIERWCVQHGQEVNADKTQLILFNNKPKIVRFKAPKICGKEITLSRWVKILGLIVDAKLFFDFHMHHKCSNAV